MPDKCGETRHIQLLSPELDATITRFAPDSKRRWHPEVYVACNHPQPEAKKRRLPPKAADVYPEMTGPFEPNDEWTAERQAFGEPDQMGVTIPIDYKTLLQSKEKSEYKQLSEEAKLTRTTVQQSRQAFGEPETKKKAKHSNTAQEEKAGPGTGSTGRGGEWQDWTHEQWKTWWTASTTGSPSDSTEAYSAWGSQEQPQQQQIRTVTLRTNQASAQSKWNRASASGSSEAAASSTSGTFVVETPLLANDTQDDIDEPLDLDTVLESLLQMTSCISASPTAPRNWSDESYLIGKSSRLPSRIAEAMSSLVDSRTENTVGDQWATTWRQLVEYQPSQWRHSQYQRQAMELIGSNWVGFTKAYNVDPCAMPTTLAIALKATQRFLEMDVQQTLQPKINNTQRVRLMENQLRWTPQGRGQQRRVFKVPTAAQQRHPDRALKLIDRTSQKEDP